MHFLPKIYVIISAVSVYRYRQKNIKERMLSNNQFDLVVKKNLIKLSTQIFLAQFSGGHFFFFYFLLRLFMTLFLNLTKKYTFPALNLIMHVNSTEQNP